MIQLRELTFTEFGDRREEWDSLVLRDPSGSIFDTWEWLFSFWRSRDKPFGASHFLVLMKEDELQCAAAFRIRKVKTNSRFVSKNIIEFLAQGALTDYNTVLVLPDSNLPELSEKMCDHLLGLSPSIDELNFKEIRNGERTLSLLSGMGFECSLTDDSKNYYLPLSSNWKDQTAKFHKSIRHTLGRCERNLMRDYPGAEFVTYRQPGEQILEQFFELHGSRMNTLSKKSELITSENIRFHKEFALSVSKKEWGRLFIIKVRGEMVAAIYGFAFKGRFCGYSSGFLAEFAKYSPVNLLKGKIIRSSIEEGLSEYDLLRGEPRYKLRWTDESRFNQRLKMISQRPISTLKRGVSNIFKLAKRHL